MSSSASPATSSTSTPGTITPATSYTSIHAVPPSVSYPYDPKQALNDLPGISYALELFLASHMVESEDYCHNSDPEKERLYFATGYGLIQSVKGLMSYADEDLLAASNHAKHGNLVASQHRKPHASLTSRLAGYVVPSIGASTSGIGWIKGMTDVERHAELVYAESLFEKALLGIVYSGDWLAFIKEALNMRTTINIYRQLGDFIAAADAEYAASQDASDKLAGTPLEDPSIDAHFRSGVYLGVGMSSLILSMMPARLLKVVELFGYKGDRKGALATLMRAGGWGEGAEVVGTADEGVRRTICDMSLLIFHLVLSSYTVDGVDVHVAKRILEWNLKRYPEGVFFLFGAGRLALQQSQPRKAIEFYTHAMSVQIQYRNLHHISFWEIATARLALWEVSKAVEGWRVLVDEASWSKTIYSYGLAACLLEVGDDAQKQEAARLMEKVPTLRQKIAGKSIPLEKFVARKARKFLAQNRRLLLPALELTYIFLGITHAPRVVIAEKMLPEVEHALVLLSHGKEGYGGSVKEKEGKGKKGGSSAKEGGSGYWDDFCLAKFLEGVCLRYIAYPDPDAVLDPDEVMLIPREEAQRRAIKAFEVVFENGPKIELDHHIVYHAHFELGRLLACQGDEEEARKQFELVLSGKPLEVNASGRKGKYSLENALHMRTHAAVEALDQHGRM